MGFARGAPEQTGMQVAVGSGDVTSSPTRPRSITVIAGVSAFHILVSQTSAISAPSSARCL